MAALGNGVRPGTRLLWLDWSRPAVQDLNIAQQTNSPLRDIAQTLNPLVQG